MSEGSIYGLIGRNGAGKTTLMKLIENPGLYSQMNGFENMQLKAIAMALICSPDILILDEPINGLDPQGIQEVRELVNKLNHEKNITILISSHILDELSKIATHYGIINQGNIIMEASADELKEHCAEKIEIITEDTAKTGVILESMNIKDYTVIDAKTIHVFSNISQSSEINRKLVLEGIPINSIQVKSDTLEEFFLKTTGEGGRSYV